MSIAVRNALRRAIRVSHSPGGVLYVGDLAHTYVHESNGFQQLVPRRRKARKDTLYDLASLTKVVATATAILKLRDADLLRLEQPVTDFLPLPTLEKVTLLHLLTHTAGFVPFNEYYREHSSLDSMLWAYATDGIENPPGKVQRYSDAGFMMLGKIVELVSRDRLDRFCHREIFDPIGMNHTAFNPPREWADNCAATENSPIRKRVIVGEVHDENAYAIGGVSGHAGLFSTAPDLAIFSRALLSGKVLRESTLVEMTKMGRVPSYPWRGLGWQMDPWASKAIGFLPSRSVFGHTGWTGTSLWLDRTRGAFSVLLGNTCHPSRAHRDNKTFRQVVHGAVGREFYPSTTNAHSGLDRLVREEFDAIRGKRIALLSNHASVDQFGRPILKALNLTGDADVRVLYSPEHGISGQAEAGEHVSSKRGRVPIVSLYSGQKAPAPDELRDIDLFVVDLQDVGARYYTYHATMYRCMKVCAQTRTPMLILDRPNPLGGAILEGPIATDTSSLVSAAHIPVRHGMTMGELAAWHLETRMAGSNLKLRVNELDSWQPARLFSECSLPWVPTSPNMPTPETALLYVGMCLFEGVNLNEGRGTDTPFALVGAPWVNGESVVAAITPEERPGCTLESVVYTPRAIPGKASHPLYRGVRCKGIRIHIERPHDVRAFTLAVALLSALQRRHPEEFEWEGNPPFDLLAGSPYLRRQIQRGRSTASIIARFDGDLEWFDANRPRFYRAKGHEADAGQG